MIHYLLSWLAFLAAWHPLVAGAVHAARYTKREEAFMEITI